MPDDDAVPRRARPGPAVLTAAAVGALALGGLLGWLTDGDGDGATDVATATSAPRDGREPTTTLPVETTTTTIRAPATGPVRSQTGTGQPVTIVFGGDVHFDGPLADRLAEDPAQILAGLQPALTDADLAVVNLETSIGSGGDRATKAFNFQASPEAFGALTGAGVDVISMANNHALDYGQSGLLQTLQAAAQVKAPIIGIGGNEMAAFAPFRTEIDGQRIAMIAATSVLDGNLIDDWTATEDHPGVASAKRTESLLAAVAAARKESDTVVVFLHWGTEKTFCPNSSQAELAPALVEAGADVVVGSHAHRVLGGGYLGHAYVGYGLGNLVFKASAGDGRDTGLLRITVTGRRVDNAEWLPGEIGTDYLPDLLTGDEAASELADWNERRECAELSDTPTDTPSDTPAESP